MGLREAFRSAAVTALQAAGNVVNDATLIVKDDSGWGDAGPPQEYPLRLVFSSFKKRGAANAVDYSFADLVQSDDVKGLMAATTAPTTIKVHQKVKRLEDGQVFTIEGFDLDAAGALFVLLLRKV